MRYRSNLTAPDLAPYFRLKNPPVQILGHDAPSDPDYEPECCFWTHDEAAILYNVACRVGGIWVDVGSRFGWTTAHIASAPRVSAAVAFDPICDSEYAQGRFLENMRRWEHVAPQCTVAGTISLDEAKGIDGFVIDGDHGAPAPLFDAMKAEQAGARVILLHDFWGQPIREAARWLMGEGFQLRIYWTPCGVACLWRGDDFQPPDHQRDESIDWTGPRNQLVSEGWIEA
jgi:hypothetical protein